MASLDHPERCRNILARLHQNYTWSTRPLIACASSCTAAETLAGRAGPWQDAPVNRAPKLNRERLRLLTGAAGVVLGEGHPTTQALARTITTWEPGDVTRARIRVRRLDVPLLVLLDDLARRAGLRA